MTHDELSNFTHQELGNFTHEELELGVPELLAKVKEDNKPISISAFEKLSELCKSLELEPKINQEVVLDISNQISKKTTFKQAVDKISEIIKLLAASADLYEKFKPIVKSIISFFQ